MRGASRASMAAAREELAAAVTQKGTATTVGEELFAVAGLLDREPGLRRALTDVTSAVGARTGLARGLLGGRVSRITLDLVTSMIGARWSSPRDLAEAAESLAVLATVASVEAGEEFDDLEDELFRFGHIVGGEPALRSALSDPQLPAERKQQLLRSLLADRVTPATLRLISQAVVHPRGRSLDESLDLYARLAASWRQRLIAVVRVATELSSGQRDRLAAALSAAYGRDIHLNVVLDPRLVGGLSIQVEDEIIDGSVASRISTLRRRLAA